MATKGAATSVCGPGAYSCRSRYLFNPTYGRWVTVHLSHENGRQLWVPAGFLHGFATWEPDTEIVYKCTAHYDRASDAGVRWDSLGIDWGVEDPLLSDKDRDAPAFGDWESPFDYTGAA